MTYASISTSVNHFMITHNIENLSALQIYNQWVQEKHVTLTCEQSVWCISLIERLQCFSKEELRVANMSDLEISHPVYDF